VAASLVLAATVAGAIAGGLLGSLGGSFPEEFRLGAVALALVGLNVLFVADVVVGPVPILQRNRTTPRRWVEENAWAWSLKAGAALGLGITNRIGFPVWYLVPVLTLGTGSSIAGAVIWAGYGLLRTGITMFDGFRLAQQDRFGTASARRLRSEPLMRRLSSSAGLAVGLAVLLGPAP
jgi:hypothetical protein